MESIESYLEKNKDRFVQELIDLLKIPSISADPAYKNDVAKASLLVEKPKAGTPKAPTLS